SRGRSFISARLPTSDSAEPSARAQSGTAFTLYATACEIHWASPSRASSRTVAQSRCPVEHGKPTARTESQHRFPAARHLQDRFTGLRPPAQARDRGPPWTRPARWTRPLRVELMRKISLLRTRKSRVRAAGANSAFCGGGEIRTPGSFHYGGFQNQKSCISPQIQLT